MKVRIILLKVFGHIWLTAAALLIWAGIVGVWMKSGFSAVQELLSPFNVVNWLAMVITLAPGLGALAWVEKLKANDPVGSERFVQIVQSGHAKASQSWEVMKKVVNEYGAILEVGAGLIVSEELLPASKQEIKQALISIARAEGATAHASAEMMEHLRVGYALLADFVSHEEAEIVKRFHGVLQTVADIKAPSDTRAIEIAEGLKDNRAIEIQKRSRDEFIRLTKEFDAAVQPK